MKDARQKYAPGLPKVSDVGSAGKDISEYSSTTYQGMFLQTNQHINEQISPTASQINYQEHKETLM